MVVLVAVPAGIAVPARAGELPAPAGESPAPPAKSVQTSGWPSAQSIAAPRPQNALHDLIDRINAADKARSSRDASSGLAGTVIDPDRSLLNLYWHGRQPAAVSKEIAAGRSRGLQVKVYSAPYTLLQLTAERDRLATRYMKNAKSGDPKVMSIGPKPDGTGLQIGVAPGAASLKAARSIIRSTVAFDVIAGDSPIRASRGLDSQPYWGGSYVENWGPIGEAPRNACTMGFSATRKNSSGAVLPVMLTAAHCGEGGDVWRLSNGAYYGQEQELTTAGHDYDAMLVGVPTNQGVIYDGPSFYDGDTNTGKPVSGYAGTVVGDRFCTSGSFSGTICNIRAMVVGVTIDVTGYGQIKQTVLSEQQDGIAAVGNGDSGGPVFYPTGTGDSQAQARGTISAIPSASVYWRPCQGVPGVPNDQEGRHCSYRFYFPDIRYQLGAYSNANILTY
jgi:hypothetical protein